MSKITIPLLMIFAAIGFVVMAKLDRDENKRTHRWPEKIAPRENDTAEEPKAVDLEERLSNEEFERLTNRELANIRLLPLSNDAYPISFLWPTDENDEPAEPELFDFARRNFFEKWKSYTDEHIGFYYPDVPGARVEVLGTTDPIPLIGPTMLPPENGVWRKYRITAGDSGTLCVISLANSNEFDDTERAPFPEIFRRFVPSGGGLLRTSFSEDGQVRRAELLGNNVHVSLLDWPHLAIHQEIYLRIAAGLQLPKPHVKWNILRQTALAKYGIEGRLGFLDHGITESQLINELGEPVARDPVKQTLEYFRSDGAENIFYTLNMRRGLFSGFSKGWRKVSRMAPAEGSLRWMCEKTDYCAGDAGGHGYDLGALSNADVRLIFDRIVELAPSAGPEDWEMIANTVTNLSQHGLRDQRLVDIARAKLDSTTLEASPGLLTLVACNSDLAKSAIAEHITREFAAPKISAEKLDQFYTLIAYLSRDHPATAQLIDRALSHESDQVRELGFKYCAWLPEQFALPHLEGGLHDPSVDVRRHCATVFANGLGDPRRHHKMLTICLNQENDEQVKLLLEEALQRLAGKLGT